MSVEYPRPETETDVGSPARKAHSLGIPFHSGRVVLEEGLDPAVLEVDRARLFVVVQFATRPDPDLLDRYEYRRLDVLTYDTHFAAVPRERVEAFAAREEVRAVASIRPEWKLEPALAEALERGSRERVPVTVGTFEPVGRFPGDVELGRVREDTYRGTLTAEGIRQLQHEHAVRWIELDTPTRLGLAQGGDLLNSRRVNVRGYTGDGIRVAVVDTGIQHDHAHFDGVRIVDSYDERDGDYYPEADNWNWSGNAHGTHVAGTVAGRSTSDGVELTGIAPDATLVVARGLGTDQFDRIAENDTDLITNSWGGGSNGGQYRTSSRYTDGWARDHEDTLLLFCYGNWNGNRSVESFVWEPGLAKNVLTVGAIHDGSDGVGVGSSSIARLNEVASLNNRTIPADGRVKPEVNAPGKWITAPVVNDSYADYQGCSMATPHVAGVVALVEEAYGGGGGSGGLTANQHRALLVATTGPVENPNGYADGYGSVDALNAIYENDYESLQRFYGGSIGEREAQTHAFSVPSGAEEVVVSLSWLDPKASANSRDTLVNDLDLYVGPETDPQRYELTDANQNVLRQVVEDPQSGDWVLTVYGWEVDGADQPYDGVLRVVTDEPTLSLDTFDRVTYASDRPNVTFPVALQGTGAPVTGAYVRVDSATGMGNCGPEFGVAGTLSARGASVVDLCFEPNARAAGDTFAVTLEAGSTNGEPRTLTRTVTVVASETTPPEPFDVTLVGHSRTGGGVDYYTDQTELTFEWERPDDPGLEPRGVAQYAYHLGRVPSSPPESAYTRVAEGDPSIDRGGTTRGVTVSGLSDGLYLFRVVAGDPFGNERPSTATVCIRTSEASEACRLPPTEEERREIDVIASSRFDFEWHELPQRVPAERLRCRGYRLCDNPGYRWLAGHERLALYVDGADGERYTYFVELDGGSVTRFEAVDGPEAMAAKEPTLNVYTDEATMMRVASDDDPLTEFAAARDAGDVRIEGVSLGAKLKLGLARFAGGVLDLLDEGVDLASPFD